MGAVPVGVDPVSVRWRSANELWVVNQISDSVSIVDVDARLVTKTLDTEDEPADVVFAGNPVKAYVSCSQADCVLVFDLSNLDAAPAKIVIEGEDPRALATSPDGLTVYAAIYESGNGSTILGGGIDGLGFPKNVVNDVRGPYGGANPPPNDGTGFDPPLNPVAGTPPEVSLIVKQNASGNWMDDNGGDWTQLVSGNLADASDRPVGWSLIDNDVAVIDTSDNSVTYAERMMNICMAMGVNPVTGRVCVVGTDAINEVRFEPVLNGRFLRVLCGSFAQGGAASVSTSDLNPQLDYSTSAVTQMVRDQAIGDPRGIAWLANGTKGFVTGMGSNNVIVTDGNGVRTGGPIEVGEGPTGLAVDDANGRVYVLNRFEGTISTIDAATDTELAKTGFFDPTPDEIHAGRKFLYDTRLTSGLGHVSCASCHVDSRMDRLAWDLGDPSGSIKILDGSFHNLGGDVPGLTSNFTDFHPMKGPMTTQTLQDIIGKEPHHWRGDRDGIEEFNGAFVSLLGDDAMLSFSEMDAFEKYLATIHFPPNPFRNLDNTLPTNLPLDGHYRPPRFGPAGTPMPNGNAQRGLDDLYRPSQRAIDQQAFACVTCHSLPTGMGPDATFSLAGGWSPVMPTPDYAGDPNPKHHHALVSVDQATQRAFKIPQTRNVYDKSGFEMTRTTSRAGFGFFHDGSIDSITRFVSEDVFTPNNIQEVADLVALMLAFSGSDFGPPAEFAEPPGTASKDAHAAVGTSVTLASAAPSVGLDLLNALLALSIRVDIVGKSAENGQVRGWVYSGSQFLRDQENQQESLATILGRGVPVTFTAVPKGCGQRLGIERDRDGIRDFDEVRDFDPAITGIQNPFRADARDATGDNGSMVPDGIPDGQNDFDGDGDSNADELAAGTNPADNLSVEVPMDASLAWNAGQTAVVLTWDGAPLGEYEVQVSENLEDWQSVPGGHFVASVSGEQFSFEDAGASGEGRRYYRVVRYR